MMKSFELRHFLAPRALMYWRYLLWRSQWYPAERMAELQNRLLRKIVSHCATEVPYYRRMFAELGLEATQIQTAHDLKYLPILGKGDVFEHHAEFRPDNVKLRRAQQVRTTGTTGTPLTLYWDINVNIMEMCSQWRHYSWMGYRLGDPFLDIRNDIPDLERDYRWNGKCRSLEATVKKIDESNLDRYIDLLRKYRIKFWRGHALAIDTLCAQLMTRDCPDVVPDLIVSLGEMLTPGKRARIEQWTGKPICDNYGLMEHTVLICQCPQGGNHICSEYGIVELIKKDGTAAAPGEEGRIVATGLHNRAFPLLRYDTGDYAICSDRVCACGRSLPLVERIIGRNDDGVLNASGEMKRGLALSIIDVDREIKYSQIVQDRAGALEFYIVPTEQFSHAIEATITKRLENVLGPGMEITFHIVDQLPHTEGLKPKFVVNKVASNAAKVRL